MQKRIRYLFRKYLDDTCSAEEFEEMFSGLRNGKNSVHFEQYLEQSLGMQSVPYPERRKNYRLAFSAAAAILIIAIAGTAWFMLRNGEQNMLARHSVVKSTVTKATQRSEYKYLLLPDSTQVWLNAASTLEFPAVFNSRKREVYLKGEAYFDVKHASEVPFIIYTGKVSTEVMGTAFNIKAYPDLEKITVSVSRGKVKVKYANKEVAVLTKGEEVSVGNRDLKVKEKLIKADQSSPWHEGNLVYDDYSIGDILSDLERIYDVKISIATPEITQLRVSTSFRRQQGVEAALEILCTLTDTHLTLENGIYTILTTPKTKT